MCSDEAKKIHSKTVVEGEFSNKLNELYTADGKGLFEYFQADFIRPALACGDRAELIIAIDQMEELWTICEAKWREPFLNFLAYIMKTPRVKVLMSILNDFWCVFAESKPMAHLIKPHSNYQLNTPEEKDLYDIIKGLIDVSEMDCEPGLILRIFTDAIKIHDLALPLLAYTLYILKDYYLKNNLNILSTKAYEELQIIT
jgi:hypothetical protein